MPRIALTFLLSCLALPALAAPAAPAAPASPPTIAILTFDYGGKNPALEPLREGLAQMLIADVADMGGVRVVERTRLKAILDEQKLGRSGKIDAASAARIGKLLGARFLVLGNYFDVAQSMRIDTRVVEVETGRIVRAVGASGASGDFLGIEQTLAGKLVGALAAALPDLASHKADAARPAPPKVKATTVATYGRALMALDDGKNATAKTLLSAVVNEAPDFRLAKAELNALLQ
jgi:TolB-like protein